MERDDGKILPKERIVPTEPVWASGQDIVSKLVEQIADGLLAGGAAGVKCALGRMCQTVGLAGEADGLGSGAEEAANAARAGSRHGNIPWLQRNITPTLQRSKQPIG